MSATISVSFGPAPKRVDPTVVRKAEPEEIGPIMKLCRQLAKENAMFNVNEDKVREMIESALDPNGNGILGVIGRVGEIEGMMLIKLGQFWYTNDWHLEELFLFVPPKYRKSDNAKKLLTWAKQLSDSFGKPLFVGVISNIKTEAKVRLYRRALGMWAGCFFMHRPAGPTEH